MGLKIDLPLSNGRVIKDAYINICKTNFNHTHYQVLYDVFESKEAYERGDYALVEAHPLTISGYDKEWVDKAFHFSYGMLKKHFTEAEDVIEDGQVAKDAFPDIEVGQDINGVIKDREALLKEAEEAESRNLRREVAESVELSKYRPPEEEF